MFTVIDRYILRALLFNYAVALGAMLSLYVVLDMFVNLDEFTEQNPSLTNLAGNIVDYYGPNLFVYFAQLSGGITLFACMATLAKMRKARELTAVLASGVSLYRVAAPVIAFGLATTALLVIDTEYFIPSVAPKLARDHDDLAGDKTYAVLFLPDRDGALLSAGQFHPITKELHQILVLYRDEDGNAVAMLEADHATWEPPLGTGKTGRWRLDRGRLMKRIRNDGTQLGPREQKQVTFPRYYESNLSPDAIQMRQSEEWIRFLSLSQLNELERGWDASNTKHSANRAAIIQTKHVRYTGPIISMIMLLLGLPFFLNRAPANILSDATKCTVVTGLCYVVTFITQSLRPETTSALPAWIPIFLFGTLAIVLVDRIRT